MPGTIKMFCIRMNILSHRNNIVLFLACNMAAMQNLYKMIYNWPSIPGTWNIPEHPGTRKKKIKIQKRKNGKNK